MLNTKEKLRKFNIVRTSFMLLVSVFCMCVEPSDCAVKGVGLRSLACLDCGFLSRREHGCLTVVNVECSKVEGSASGWSPVQRIVTEYGVSECDLESPVMMKPLTTRSFCAMGRVIIYVIQSSLPINTRHTACLSFILTCFFGAVICIVYILTCIAGMLIKTIGHILLEKTCSVIEQQNTPHI
jgi:hypothetical protein